jgi:hypothetical protein
MQNNQSVEYVQEEDNLSEVTESVVENDSDDSFVQIVHREINGLKQQIDLERFMNIEKYAMLEQNFYFLENRLKQMTKEKQILLLLLQSKKYLTFDSLPIDSLPIAPGLP